MRAMDCLPKHYDRLHLFRAYFETGTPILTYHAIAQPPRGTKYRGLFYPPERFSRQLAELREARFQTVWPGEARVGSDKVDRRIVLTFDDGFRSVYEGALPLLAENHFRATAFLVANYLGKTNQWDTSVGVAETSLMDAAQVREWLSGGQRIGSHTLTHPHLDQLSPERAREEIQASKKKLEDVFGVPVTDFCYPYGDWDARLRELVAEGGYLTACTSEFGLNTVSTDPFALCRITVRRPNRSLKTVRTWAKRQCLLLLEKLSKF